MQELGERLRGECHDFLASPGRGLQCTVVGVEESGESGEGGRVKRYPCVVTEASLMSKPIVNGDGESRQFKVSGIQCTYVSVCTSTCIPYFRY